MIAVLRVLPVALVGCIMEEPKESDLSWSIWSCCRQAPSQRAVLLGQRCNLDAEWSHIAHYLLTPTHFTLFLKINRLVDYRIVT